MINQPPEYSPEEARLHIRTQVEAMKKAGFSWCGRRSLPLREDVYRYICHRAMSEHSGLDLRRIDLPHMMLQKDGTVSLSFFRGGRKLELQFPCEGVVLFRQEFADKSTEVDGTIQTEGRSADEWEEVNAKLDWCFPRRIYSMPRRGTADA